MAEASSAASVVEGSPCIIPMASVRSTGEPCRNSARTSAAGILLANANARARRTTESCRCTHAALNSSFSRSSALTMP